VSFALVVSPTRRASRATLPARGRDRNGVTPRNDQSLVQSVAHEVARYADAAPSLPARGRDRNGVTRRSVESLMQCDALEGERFFGAAPSLPLTGRVVREANRVG
jgi:hypothetical protein